MGMNTRAFDKWMRRIEDTRTPWTENEIIYFRKAIGMGGMNSLHLQAVLVNQFRLRNPIYSITHEHSEKGRQYLLSRSLKKNGQLRKGSRLGERELNILRDPKLVHYFVGLHGRFNTLGELVQYLPIYRATDSNGTHFEYVGATYDLVQIVG